MSKKPKHVVVPSTADRLHSLATRLGELVSQPESDRNERIEGIADDLRTLGRLVGDGVTSRATYEVARHIYLFVRYELDTLWIPNQVYRDRDGRPLNRGRIHQPVACDLRTKALITKPVDPYDKYTDFEIQLSHLCQAVLSVVEPVVTGHVQESVGAVGAMAVPAILGLLQDEKNEKAGDTALRETTQIEPADELHCSVAIIRDWAKSAKVPKRQGHSHPYTPSQVKSILRVGATKRSKLGKRYKRILEG